MNTIRSLDQLIAALRDAPSRRVAVAAGHDPNTIRAAARAASEQVAEITLVGDGARIDELCGELDLDRSLFAVIDEPEIGAAGECARDMVRDGRADVLMKGLIGTGDYMRLILDKECGLLPRGAVLTHLTVLELPAFVERHGKLLLVSDVAIIPRPDKATKKKILRYCVDAAHSFGIERPRAALLAASEKVSLKMPALDVAISPEACAIKGLDTPVGGAADILVFPNIESGNVFYKASTLLAGGRLAAAVVGTTAPCVLTSRADSEESKFLSIAFGCRLAG